MEVKIGDPFINQAHRVDMPEAFYSRKDDKGKEDGFFKHAAEIGSSKVRKDKVTNLALYCFDLHNYKKTLGFTDDEIRLARGKKIFKLGGFDKGIIQTDETGFSKLVRDNYEGRTSYEDPTSHEVHTYTYRHADQKEIMGFLGRKLVEESKELRGVKLKDEHGKERLSSEVYADRLNELADIYEVLDVILEHDNIKQGEIDSRIHAWEFTGIITNNQRVGLNKQH